MYVKDTRRKFSALVTRERREMKDVDSANDEKETKTTSGASASKSNFDSVVVHPLVLLSVVDHFKRVDEVIHNACFFSSVFSHFLRSDFDDDDVMMMMMSISLCSLSLCVCSLKRDDCIDVFSLLFLLITYVR